MIHNEICAYCREKLVKAENKPNSRSVEHMIPNAATSRKRKNDEGDFYVCRKCNCRKSKFDNFLGKLSKVHSYKEEVVIEAVTKELEKTKSKFKNSFESPKYCDDRVEFPLPFGADEIIEFILFIAKGQYLKNTSSVFNPKKLVIIPTFLSKQELLKIEEYYRNTHGRSPFRDLEKNRAVETVDSEYSIVSSGKNKMMVLLHDYTGFLAEIRPKNNRNIGLSVKAISRLKEQFNTAETLV